MSDTSDAGGKSRPRKRDLPPTIAPLVPVQIPSDVDTSNTSEFELRVFPPRLIARGQAADRLVYAVSFFLVMAGLKLLFIDLSSLKSPFERAVGYLYCQASACPAHSDKELGRPHWKIEQGPPGRPPG